MSRNRKINFTKKKIEELEKPDKEKQIYYRDTQTRGLALSVARGGTKSFVFYRKIQGNPGRILLGAFPDMTIEQARAKAAELNAEIARGLNPLDKMHQSKDELTLGELFQHYIDGHAKKKRKTWQVMQQDFQRNLGHWSKRKLSSIMHADVEYLHQQLAANRGPYTANRTLQLFRAVYNKGILWRLYSGDNPANGISLFPEKARERFLSQAEVKRLLMALKTETDDALRDFVWLSILTGARKSNILSMRWEDVDLKGATWFLPETKNGTSQTIALTQVEIQLLKERFKKQKSKGVSEFVFPGNGATKHLVDPKNAWSKLRERAELEDFTLHDLRRNLGSWMASLNVNTALIKSALHHKDLKTTIRVYARTSNDAERDGRQKAHDAMFKAAGITRLAAR